MPRRFAVTIEGVERVVELDDAASDDARGARLRARLEDAPAGWDGPIELWAAGPGLFVIARGSEQTLAQVDGSAPKWTVSLRRPGRDVVLVGAEVSDARRARIAAPPRATADAGAPVTVRSPIPGRVVKVTAKAGDKVTQGQTLVVVEAMKMENELRAPRAGTVTEIRCAEGAAVEAGQDLVVVG